MQSSSQKEAPKTDKKIFLTQLTNSIHKNVIVVGEGGQDTYFLKGLLIDYGTLIATKRSMKVDESHLGQFIKKKKDRHSFPRN